MRAAPGWGGGLRASLVAVLAMAGAACARAQPGPGGAEAQPRPLVGRAAVESLVFPPLRFHPPPAQRRTLASGARLLVVEDRTLPLVEVMVRFRGGASHFPRDRFGAVSALPALLRGGGTRRLSADSVDALIEYHAWRMGFGAGGTSSFARVETLTRDVEPAVSLWAEMLREPRFQEDRVEVWRGREAEAVRRRRDDPNFDAVTLFNHLLYGDHPVGWVLDQSDLEPDKLSAEELGRLQAAIYCPQNATFGVAGDIDADSAAALLDAAFAGWRACPRALADPPDPAIRHEPGVFVVHRPLAQTTIYMGHAGGITSRDGPEYFASGIANAILGGSGLSSRLVRAVRTELGLAYGAGTVWTAPRGHEGVFAAFTQTRSDAAIEAVHAVVGVLDGLRDERPPQAEVDRAVAEMVNGFVFNFGSPARVVSRQMLYAAEGLGEDWLERYVEGIQSVSPADVQRVARTRIHPSRMTLLIIGDTTAFDAPLASLGLGEPVMLPEGG